MPASPRTRGPHAPQSPGTMNNMAEPLPLPLDVLPCLSGDVILIPRGLISARLTPEQQHELAARLPALQGADLSP